MSSLIIEILITLLFSAFFSAAEIAFFSSNKLLIELESKSKTKSITVWILNKFYSKPDEYISSMLVGNVIALVIYGLLMVRLLTPILVSYISGDFLILLLQSIIATIFMLFCGEFIPKSLARLNPNSFLSIFAVPLYITYLLLYPVSKLVSLIARGVFYLFGVKFSQKDHKNFGREDLDFFIQKTIDETSEDTELETEVRFFQNAMEFSQVKVRDCMVPRTEIIAIDKSTLTDELTTKFVETGLSKIVVYEGDIDNIIGYIHSSELFNNPPDWTELIMTLPFVPENIAANKLMKNMLAEKKSMAIVVDEFGGTSGLVTLEDLVEEIFGDIEDEHDTKLFVAKRTAENEYVLSGRMEIDRVNEQFGLNIPESDEYMTIAGYILEHHQRLPKLNETIWIDQFDFKIIKVTRTKIELVKLRLREK